MKASGQLAPLFSPVMAGALLAGLLLALALPRLPPVFLLWAVLGVGLLGLWRLPAAWRHAAMLCVGFAWLGLHGHWRMAQWLAPSWQGQVLTLPGQVLSLPEHQVRRTRFDFRVDDAAPVPEALRGKRLRVSWYAPHGQEAEAQPSPRHAVQAGERWQLAVRLAPVRGLRNPGGFDAERQLLLDGIAAQAQVREGEGTRRLRAGRGLQAWRGRMAERIVRDTRSDSARFVAALAIGDTRGLSDADWQVLRANGLTHLIAISGFHVGMVGLAAAGMAWLLWQAVPALGRRCPRRMGMALAAFAASFAYMWASGAALPTVRTVLMMAFVAGAVLLRRRAGIGQSVALAGMLILLWEPLSLLRPGFWLSFAGVIWLAWCLQGEDGTRWRRFVAAQAVVSLGLLPLTAAFFDEVSLLSPLVNLLAVPWWSLLVVPLAILGVLAEVLVPGSGGSFWTLAGQVFAPLWPLFEALAASPLALYRLAEFPLWAVPLALFAAWVLLQPRGFPGKWLAPGLFLPLVAPPVPRPAEGEVALLQLDVGQGLALIVRTRQHTLLYDTGPAQPEGFDAGARIVVPALRALGVRRLDGIVLSHADSDHAGGLAGVTPAYPGATLWAPPGAGVAGSAPCQMPQSWEWDGVRFEFLHPGAHFPYLRNQSSCVLRMTTRHGRILLSGDIDRVVEARLMRLHGSDGLHAEVVSVPHHGSRSSSSPAFVEAVKPRLALVSAGYGNRFGHPNQAVLVRWQAAGAHTAISAETGALHVHLNAEGLHWQGERARRPRFWDAQALAQDRAGE